MQSLRLLVVAPADDLRAVADAPVGDVVEGDLDDQLRPQVDPLEVAVGRPAAGVGRAALAGRVRLEDRDQLALLLGLQAGGVADDPQLLAVVGAEDQRADGALLLAGAPADDHQVGGPHPLDLDHALALAGPVGRVELLGDHALAALQPGLGLGGILGERRQLDAARVRCQEPIRLLERGTALAQRDLQRAFPPTARMSNARKTAGVSSASIVDPRLRRVQAVLQRVELLGAVGAEDHQLSVEHVLAGGEPSSGK